MKFISIPVRIWNDRESKWELQPRIFNPRHIVSLEPYHEADGCVSGTLETVTGNRHSIPAEKYHATFVALMGEEGA